MIVKTKKKQLQYIILHWDDFILPPNMLYYNALNRLCSWTLQSYLYCISQIVSLWLIYLTRHQDFVYFSLFEGCHSSFPCIWPLMKGELKWPQITNIDNFIYHIFSTLLNMRPILWHVLSAVTRGIVQLSFISYQKHFCLMCSQ